MLPQLQRFRPTKLISIGIGIAMPLSLTSCLSAPKPLQIATGSSTGYYYQLGQAIQDSAKETVDLDLTVEESKGSLENLKQLLKGDTDIALMQLDVAQPYLRTGDIQAIAILAQEHVHLISRRSFPPISSSPTETASTLTLEDFRGKILAVGTPGSGIHFTADELLSASNMSAAGEIKLDESSFSDALDRLSADKVDAAFYVGRLGASDRLRAAFAADPNLTILPLSQSLINFLVTKDPGVYKAAVIPEGIYSVNPSIPDREIATLTTPTVLVARPDVDPKMIRLITWAIIATARRYAPYYPELQSGDPNSLLREGLFYIHPAAVKVYEHGDPREAWIRYWENNSDLQASIFLLIGTSAVGMLFQRWRKQQSQHLLTRTQEKIASISQFLNQKPQEALQEIEELSQENRLQFITGKVPDEIYAIVQQKTQTCKDQCRSILDRQHRQLVLDTLLLLDDWQETLQSDPQAAIGKLSQIRQQYRGMLLANQVDIQAYMELVELTLISVMTLAPKHTEAERPIPELSAALSTGD